MKAEEIMKAMRQPVPCATTAQTAMAVPLIESISPLAEVARRSWAANGAVRSSGYAGKTQVGVIVWRGKTLNRALEETLKCERIPIVVLTVWTRR
jgi:hypothetical protein